MPQEGPRQRVYRSLEHRGNTDSPSLSSTMNTRRPRTSCTACRAARIGCDAATQKPARCSNCVRRGKVCDVSTTAAQSAARRTPSDGVVATVWGSSNESASEETARHDLNDSFSNDAISRTSTGFTSQNQASQCFPPKSPPFSNAFLTPSPSSFDVDSVACRRLQATMLNGLLWDIYFKVFELRFAIWLGNSCCPFLELTPVRVVALNSPC